ncbi:aldo/keto reductase [Novosphingobium sp. 9]|uniref:aldo/keto reductase n=1 Tax=Novosphingobium sp. 9 TaxID=2025349 RepID=UPI0021B590C4|nr:aldo/keto reductase [Novosphingobium sp. 9]
MTVTLSSAPVQRLNNGVEIPRLGLGTWPMEDAEAENAVRTAIEAGYRLIDTAENYRNEQSVGEGIRTSGVPREDIFVTTKFNREWHSVEGVQEACKASLKRLGLDYIDLLLIHWPNPDQDRYVAAYEGMERLREQGLVRALGTSNFKIPHLEKLLAAGHVPQLNQIQLDPYRRRDDIVAFHEGNGIATETWSPIGRGDSLLGDPAITAIAQAHDRTPAQIVLRWHIQSSYLPVPKSGNPQRQIENLDVFEFELKDDEMETLNGLGQPDAEIVDADSFGH